ncbi:MAG: hypothetical protein LV479_09025 [Methylacidiphilales bacterium]|nr:hypothetical protein [Candidatus Methylacidiphilales bacterium]
MIPSFSSSLRHRGMTVAGILSVALTSVLLLCGAGSVPIENFLPQGPMQGDLNAGGYNITNAATVCATNFAGNGAALTNLNANACVPLPLKTNLNASDVVIVIGESLAAGSNVNTEDPTHHNAVSYAGPGKCWAQWLSQFLPNIPVYSYGVGGADSSNGLGVLAGTSGFYGATKYVNGSVVGSYSGISSLPGALIPSSGSGGTAYFINTYDGNNDNADGRNAATFATNMAAIFAAERALASNVKICAVTSQFVNNRTPGTIDPYNSWTRSQLGQTGGFDILIDVTPTFTNPYDTNFYDADHAHLVSAGCYAYAEDVRNALLGNPSPVNLTSLFIPQAGTGTAGFTWTGPLTYNNQTFLDTYNGDTLFELQSTTPSTGHYYTFQSSHLGQLAVYRDSMGFTGLLWDINGNQTYVVPNSGNFTINSAGNGQLNFVLGNSVHNWTSAVDTSGNWNLYRDSMGLTGVAIAAGGNQTYTVPDSGSFTINPKSSGQLNFVLGNTVHNYTTAIDSSGNWNLYREAMGLTAEVLSASGNFTYTVPNGGSYTINGNGSSGLSFVLGNTVNNYTMQIDPSGGFDLYRNSLGFTNLAISQSGNWTVTLPSGGQFNVMSGTVAADTAGYGFATKEGSNAKQGTATLTGGTVTVSDSAVTANSRIFLTVQSPGGTVGVPYVSVRTAGTSFTITSTSGSDTSTVAYELFEPAP